MPGSPTRAAAERTARTGGTAVDGQPDRGGDLVAFEHPVPVERHAYRDLRLVHGQAGDEREQERSREGDRLDAPEREACDEPHRCRAPRRQADGKTCSRSRAGGAQRVLGGRRRHRLQRLFHHVLGAEPLHPELGPHRQPVRERRHRDAFTSSGVTKSRPASAAFARDSLRSAMLPRGLAPTASRCESRVAVTRSTT